MNTPVAPDVGAAPDATAPAAADAEAGGADAGGARRLAGAPPRSLVLLGHPVAHSLSPRFQQAALDAAGLDARYVARDVPPEALAEVLRDARAQALAGNVTIPHKEAVAAACDVLTPIARRAGAVNTFGIDARGRLVGHNTDVRGAECAIAAVRPAGPDGATVGLEHAVVIGAGGSAAAVLLALEALGAARITLVVRTPARARALVDRLALGPAVRIVREAVDASASLVVNATPLGLRDDDPWPVAPHRLPAGCAVLDLVYRPGETTWVRAARARGHRAEDGLRMLVEQGAAAFAWWFGVPPDRAAMWRVLEPRPAMAGGA